MSADETTRAELTPPSVLRAAWLIACLEGRRWLNRRPFKRRASEPGRTGTARKGAPARLLLALVSFVLVFNVVSQTTRLVRTVAQAAERAEFPDQALVSRDTLETLDAVLDGTRPTGTLWRSQDELLAPVFDNAARDEQLLDQDERHERAREIAQLFAQRGRAAFRKSSVSDDPWPSTGLWFRSGRPGAMTDPFSLVCLLLGFAVVSLCVVGSDRDLARSEASLEWWFSFPVPTRGLLLARLLGSALVSPLAWLVLLPFYTVVFWCAGKGPWLGSALALGATLYLCLLAASVRIALETTLRRWLAPRRIAHVQAGLEIVASFPFLLLVAASSRAGANYLVAHAHALPGWSVFAPLTLPLAWLLPDGRAGWAGLATLATGAATSYGAVALGSAMLRNGLLSAGEPVLGTRGPVVKSGGREQSLLQVVARRELLALVRDPGRLARVLLVPVAMIGVLALTDPAIFRAIISKPGHASAAAFGVGIVVLSGGGLVSLANEGPGLWLLYTAPHALDRILLCRAALWSCIGSCVSALVLIALAVAARAPGFVLGGHALLAIVGVTLYAFVAVALGALGTDVLESARIRRLQPYVSQLFLLLSGMFSYALYSPSGWVVFVQLALSSVFAFALWQKLRDHCPFFLDPVAAPPTRISVSDGVFAAQAFFVLQGLIGLLLLSLRVSWGVALVVSFAGAGLVTTAGALYALMRMGIPSVPEAIGLWTQRAQPVRALALGAAAGALAGAGALVYQQALTHISWLHALAEHVPAPPSAEQLPWIAGLAVFAAPLFEEFIFRGLLYRGFRRSLRPLNAALASSLIFAVVHPPGSFVPVFFMALLAAAVFERSRLLLAPIVAHMTYNAIIVGLALDGV